VFAIFLLYFSTEQITLQLKLFSVLTQTPHFHMSVPLSTDQGNKACRLQNQGCYKVLITRSHLKLHFLWFVSSWCRN